MNIMQISSINGSVQRQVKVVLTVLSISCAASLIPLVSASAQGLPFTEDFSTDALKDISTTADWDTGSGSLKLPLSTSTDPVQSLNNAFVITTRSSVDAGDDVSSRAVALGDLDGDGDLDIAFGNIGSNRIYFNDGTGGFVAGSPIPGINDHFGSNSRSVRIADFNGDGHLDVLFSEFGSGQANRILFNNGSGGPQIFDNSDFEDLGPASLNGDGTAVGDVDGDGDLDIIIGMHNDHVQLFLNDGFGNFSDPQAISDSLSTSGFFARSVALGDLDRNGTLDLVAALAYGTTRVYLGDGNGGFNFQLDAGGGAINKLSAPDSMVLGDVDGDGYLDIVIGNDGSNSDLPTDGNPNPGVQNRIYFNNNGLASDLFPSSVAFTTDMFNTNGVRLADVDRDGDLDIITAELTDLTTPNTNRLYINDGVGNFAAAVAITTDSNLTKSIAIGDLNNDGVLDLVTANDPQTGVVGSAINTVILNGGTLSGNFRDQVYATASSSQVDTGEDLSDSLILTSTLVNNSIANPVFSYWMSADGGARWVAVQPGRSISFPFSMLAQDLRWRTELNTLSTGALWRPALTSLNIIANRPARITSTEVTAATQDQLYTYAITATEPDGESIEIRETSSLPTWLTLTDNGDGTATLEGTPTNDNIGTVGNEVDLEAIDASTVVGPQGAQSFTITVADVNDAPTVMLPTGDQIFTQGDVVDLDASLAFADVDVADVLSYSATGLPAGLDIDTASGLISGTLTNDDAINSPYMVTITADDSNGGTVDDAFMLTVINVNEAPEFTSTPGIAVTEPNAYAYNITVVDADGDAIAITAAGLPAWLTFTDNGDGTASLSGTPAAADVGASAITLTADDATVQTLQQFTVTVSAAPPPPPPPKKKKGGGSFGPLTIICLFGLMLLGRRRKRMLA